MTKTTTYNGKTYEMGTEPAYPSKPGDVFYDADKKFCRLTPLGCSPENDTSVVRAQYMGLHSTFANPSVVDCIYFPLYQAIEVRESELVGLEPIFQPLTKEGLYIGSTLDIPLLHKQVERALMADKVVITCPDGSIETFTKKNENRWDSDQGGSWYQASGIGGIVEQALMAGRRVQIQESANG